MSAPSTTLAELDIALRHLETVVYPGNAATLSLSRTYGIWTASLLLMNAAVGTGQVIEFAALWPDIAVKGLLKKAEK